LEARRGWRRFKEAILGVAAIPKGGGTTEVNLYPKKRCSMKRNEGLPARNKGKGRTGVLIVDLR